MSDEEHDPTENAADLEPEDADQVDEDEADEGHGERRPDGPDEARNVGG